MSRGRRAGGDPTKSASWTQGGRVPAPDKAPGDARGEPAPDGAAPDIAVQDINAVRRDDDVVTALAGRRVIDTVAASDVSSDVSSHVSAAADDGAIRLLRALIADVDAGAPPLRVTTGSDRQGERSRPKGRSRRRTARIIVPLGVAAIVLTTSGVAAAGPARRRV